MNIIADINRVIPEDVLAEIIGIRDRESNLAWDYGNMANRVYHYIIANELPYTKLEACGFVAYMVDNHRAPNTILKYSMVAEFFANKKAREKYDFLPFSHFELAIQFGKDWRKVLEKSASLMAGSFGRPPTRAKLDEIFAPQKQKLSERIAFDVPADSIVRQTAEIEPGSDIDDLRNLLARLQAKLQIVQAKYPRIAAPLAQALIIITEALKYDEQLVEV